MQTLVDHYEKLYYDTHTEFNELRRLAQIEYYFCSKYNMFEKTELASEVVKSQLLNEDLIDEKKVIKELVSDDLLKQRMSKIICNSLGRQKLKYFFKIDFQK